MNSAVRGSGKSQVGSALISVSNTCMLLIQSVLLLPKTGSSLCCRSRSHSKILGEEWDHTLCLGVDIYTWRQPKIFRLNNSTLSKRGSGSHLVAFRLTSCRLGCGFVGRSLQKRGIPFQLMSVFRWMLLTLKEKLFRQAIMSSTNGACTCFVPSR